MSGELAADLRENDRTAQPVVLATISQEADVTSMVRSAMTVIFIVLARFSPLSI